VRQGEDKNTLPRELPSLSRQAKIKIEGNNNNNTQNARRLQCNDKQIAGTVTPSGLKSVTD